ncbi:antibiotic biosynthesis monooxygenase [Porphyrobacter algicida]|uniref:Antibiotic biosynthesis monooxygenase n=1 Tax=Qipengyuania algicida TaxID=1836209 RepID=A0A845AKS3_9SPHN|nr:putative quinol monooxygenase [Qipengyuania algicida]MXP30069.1 antibiotic biosynthesis monooxygenase [Qipengyuania algicida]
MIQINGTIRIDRDKLDDAREALVTMMEKSRAEDGCLMYTFAQDLSDPQVLLLCERWRDGAALDAHGKSEHMQAFREVLKANSPISSELTIFNTDDGKPL